MQSPKCSYSFFTFIQEIFTSEEVYLKKLVMLNEVIICVN